MHRSEELKQAYGLQQHREGGWFSEVYTAPFKKEQRPLAGSIYFLLDAGEISHFHEIDCDEIWYFHEGCGMKITAFVKEDVPSNDTAGSKEQGILENMPSERQKMPCKKVEFLLGKDVSKGQRAMVVIPKDSIFAAENLDPDGFTFVSCATTPQFTYEGFRLVYEKEIRDSYPECAEDVLYLAYKD